RAGSAFREIIPLAEEAANKNMVALALGGLARVASREGDLPQALAWYEESLVIRRQLGVPVDVAQALNNVGAVAMKLGDYQRAIVCTEEATAISAESGNKEH